MPGPRMFPWRHRRNKPLIHTIRRLWAMDALLGSSGLNIRTFAKRYYVKPKTVLRDRQLLQRLGQPSYREVNRKAPKDQQYLWRYKKGSPTLFRPYE